MKVASIVGSSSVSSSEGHKIFKPVHKIFVVQEVVDNALANNSLLFSNPSNPKIPCPSMSVRLVDNLNNPEIVSMTSMDILSEISTKSEGFLRRMCTVGKNSDDDHIISGRSVFCLTLNDRGAVSLNNDKYLSVDLSGLLPGFSYSIYGFEYPVVELFSKRYVKQFLPSQDLEKSFMVGNYEYLALPLSNLSELQLFNETGINSTVYTSMELLFDQDMSNDLSTVPLSSDGLSPIHGITNVPAGIESFALCSTSSVLGIEFSHLNYAVISLKGVSSFNIKRLASEGSFDFFLIDSI